jgi:N,N'-diacetyllegionaminate synthase
MELAKQLIDVAAEAGAEFVKFQTFDAKRLASKQAKKAQYQMSDDVADASLLTMLQGLELTPGMHDELRAHCALRQIEFFSTAFDIPSLQYLNSLGLPLVKVPSGEITNLPYLRYVGSLRKRVILSTGMCTLGEIEAAIEILEKSGTERKDITVLHCNTEYPTPMQDVNLKAMESIGHAFKVPVGYSDHTQGIEVAIAAVALGATVIEKHFTLDRRLPGPDHAASLEPSELITLVRAIRNIEFAMGDGIKRPSDSETKNIEIARKSIVAAKDIARGEVFTEENITVKRPATGLSPMKWDSVVGRVATRNFQEDECIEL